ncbi:hypothetical protein [Thermomonas carbonis]|uniref:Uncharacterized protein n=1 Tax=Thermomonas carbonis TaxID=1463158 RepID=A0A7G9SRM1_9GAMM|nr:hypothetical protein [Thermomonas carbonis]QNN70496.1 hypothetical protein H9L16_02385 [Thermomonas carbonis]
MSTGKPVQNTQGAQHSSPWSNLRDIPGKARISCSVDHSRCRGVPGCLEFAAAEIKLGFRTDLGEQGRHVAPRDDAAQLSLWREAVRAASAPRTDA